MVIKTESRTGFPTCELASCPPNMQTTPFSPSNIDLLNCTVYSLNGELCLSNTDSDKEI